MKSKSGVGHLHFAIFEPNHAEIVLKPTSPNILPATIADGGTIRALAEQIWPSTYIPIIGREQVDFMLNLFYSEEVLARQIGNGEQHFLISFCDGKPVGFASYSDMGERIAKLNKLYVHTAKQGTGLGKALLQRVVDDVMAMGARQLTLNVNRHNLNAIRFYEKWGFARTAVEDIHIGNGYFMNDYIYSVSLQP